MNGTDPSETVKALAREVGFNLTGIARAEPLPGVGFLDEWLASGYAGGMAYLHRNRETRENPAAILPGARSIVVVAMNYHAPTPAGSDDGRPRGRIARYAWGRDYHAVMRERLDELAERMRQTIGERFAYRACVDTAPILERQIAAAAGIGWIGKNTLVLNAKLGSYFVLGELITTLELEPDAPATDHCGTCTRCLDACPTRAFVRPHVMDARRCISYLTIEHRGEIAAEFHDALGDWIFGCDICQEVCPFNRRAPETREPDFAARPPAPSVALQDVLDASPEEYVRLVHDRAIGRARLEMLRRNAAIAWGNRSHRVPPPPLSP